MGGQEARPGELIPALPGYRRLSQEELALIDQVKAAERDVLGLCVALRQRSLGDGEVDGRFLSLGITEIETGFMHVVRSIARPSRPDGLDWAR